MNAQNSETLTYRSAHHENARNRIQHLILAAAVSAGLGLGFSADVFAQGTHFYIADLNSKTVTDLGTLGEAGYAVRH